MTSNETQYSPMKSKSRNVQPMAPHTTPRSPLDPSNTFSHRERKGDHLGRFRFGFQYGREHRARTGIVNLHRKCNRLA